DTYSPPDLPIISPCVMYFRRSVLILPRTICLNRLASRSILRTTAVRPSPLGLGAAALQTRARPETGRRLPGCAAGRHPVSAVHRAENQKIAWGKLAWERCFEVGRRRFGLPWSAYWYQRPRITPQQIVFLHPSSGQDQCAADSLFQQRQTRRNRPDPVPCLRAGSTLIRPDR